MNNLITLQAQSIGGNTIETVSARELHSFLEVGRDFSNWIKARISKYGFVENTDYITLAQIGELENKGLQGRIEYYITLDMAKQLAMVENNDKGMQARKYFIECERQLKNPTPAKEVQPTSELENKYKVLKMMVADTSLSPIAQETLLITLTETLTGVSIGYRPQIEQTTYSAKELGDILGISANKVGRIANNHQLKTKEYGLYYLNKSQYSDKQVEHFRYFEKAIDKFKWILDNEE